MLDDPEFRNLYGAATPELLRDHERRNRERAERASEPDQRALLLALAEAFAALAAEKESPLQ